MKNIVKITSLSILILLYSLSLCFINTKSINSDNYNNNNYFLQSDYILAVPGLLIENSQLHTSLNQLSNTINQSFKNPNTGLWLTFQINEKISKTETINYSNKLKSICISPPKTTIIFPFNYFW